MSVELLLQGWFEALRVETAQYNITVTTICPGPVHSAVQREAFTGVAGQVTIISPIKLCLLFVFK